jgi:aspartokinase
MVQAQSDGVSFAVQSSPRLAELLRCVDPSVRIDVEEQSGIVTLVGDGIASETSTMQRALSVLARGTGVRMVSQGGSRRSIRFAVPESKLTVSVENLHREFFRTADPEIFASTPESSHRWFVEEKVAERSIEPNSDWALKGKLIPAR